MSLCDTCWEVAIELIARVPDLTPVLFFNLLAEIDLAAEMDGSYPELTAMIAQEGWLIPVIDWFAARHREQGDRFVLGSPDV